MSSNKALEFRLKKQEELLDEYEKTIENMQIAIIKELNNINNEMCKGNTMLAHAKILTLKREIKEDLIGGNIEL